MTADKTVMPKKYALCTRVYEKIWQPQIKHVTVLKSLVNNATKFDCSSSFRPMRLPSFICVYTYTSATTSEHACLHNQKLSFAMHNGFDHTGIGEKKRSTRTGQICVLKGHIAHPVSSAGSHTHGHSQRLCDTPPAGNIHV